VFCAAFLYLQFGFVIFWQKNIDAKAALKMLLKLTKGLLIIAFLLLQQVPHDGHVVAVRKNKTTVQFGFRTSALKLANHKTE